MYNMLDYIEILESGNAIMKYFIDFEATQYTNEIISVGCVDENGREFYTLVQPHKMKRLTKFITELTGITTEDLQNAPTVDEAFSVFYDWLDSSEPAEFYCYGYSDKEFVRRTLSYAASFYAQCGLCLIKNNLVDFAQTVKTHFLISKDIALVKVVEHYRKEAIDQSHNALEDALLLKEVYDNLKNEVITECPFPDHQTANKAESETDPVGKAAVHIEAVKGNTTVYFPSYKKAADWVMRSLIPKNTTVTDKTKSRISNHIRRAIEKDEHYFGFKWYLLNS